MKKIDLEDLKAGMCIPYNGLVYRIISDGSEIGGMERRLTTVLGAEPTIGERQNQYMRFWVSKEIEVLDDDEVEEYLALKRLGQ